MLCAHNVKAFQNQAAVCTAFKFCNRSLHPCADSFEASNAGFEDYLLEGHVKRRAKIAFSFRPFGAFLMGTLSHSFLVAFFFGHTFQTPKTEPFLSPLLQGADLHLSLWNRGNLEAIKKRPQLRCGILSNWFNYSQKEEVHVHAGSCTSQQL